MEQLLAWQNLIFYIPIAFGLLMVVGTAMGLGGDHDHDAGHDLDHDVDGDADHGLDHDADAESEVDKHVHVHADHTETNLLFKAFSVLGVGKVPLSIVLMISSLIFGGAGIIINSFLEPILTLPALYGPVSIAASFALMVVTTGRLANLISRFMPSTETYRVSKDDLCGKIGTLTLPASTKTGWALVKDHEGNLHNIRCRTYKGELPKNSNILVVEYDAATKTYIVAADPMKDLECGN